MIGIGTLVNGAAIVAGGLCGLLGGSRMNERCREGLSLACGISVLFIGIAGAMEKMLTVSNGVIGAGQSMLLTICLALGAFFGELMNIEGAFERFGVWLKKKTGNSGDPVFVEGFVTASLTVSIGAMAIVGSIRDGIFGDWSILAAKAVLDFAIVLVMTCAMGRGCIFSAIPVFVFEGVMTLAASLLKPLMTDLALSYISLIGSVLIFCVGLNLVFGKKIRVANLLPAILLAAVAAFLPM